MIRRVLVLIVLVITSCNLEKDYRNNGKVAFIYKKKIFEIEGKYLTEDLSNKVYVLFDSIKINKNEIKNLVIEFPDDIFEQDDGGIYFEEDEDQEFYDEYWLLTNDKETIKITEEYIKNNFQIFK